MKKRARSARCPTCKAIVLKNEPEFPFCSERCRLIDLGKWASGAYVVSTPVRPTDEVVDLDAIEQAEERARRADSESDASRASERNKRTG
jgi:endogenous inhibitor of DNA gyrase (YacG/DUF329 family)